MGDGAVGDGVDHLGAFLDDAALLEALADDVAGGVLQEDQGSVDLVGQLDELGGLLGFLAEEHALLVRQDADGVAVQGAPAGGEGRAVLRLVLLELRAVEQAGEHLVRAERHAQVGRGDAEQFRRVVQGLDDRLRPRTQLCPVPALDDLPSEPDGVALVGGQVVREPGDGGVHARAAELLVGGHLAGGHLHQRGTAEEHLRLLVDHDVVVAHARHVRAAGRGVAEDERDGRDAHGRELREVTEELAGRDEEVGLRGQVRAAGLDEVHDREPVEARDVQRAQHLLPRVRVRRPALDRAVVRDEHAFDAVDDADAGHDAGADGEVGTPGRERRELEEGGAGIDQQVDPLAAGEPAALAVPRHVLGAATGPGDLELVLEQLEHAEVVSPVAQVLIGIDVDVRPQSGHAPASKGQGS